MSVAVNIWSLIFYFDPRVPELYHAMVSFIVICVTNSMACQVYRDIRFGRVSSTSMVSTSNARTAGNSIPLHLAHRRRDNNLYDVDVSTMDKESTTLGSDVTKARLPHSSFQSEVPGSEEA